MNPLNNISCTDTALLVIDRHIAVQSLEHYAGLLTMHALVNLAQVTGSKEIKEKSVKTLEPFFCGRVNKVSGVYDKMYRCGGYASALLVKYSYVPEITGMLITKAEELIQTHPRHPLGAFGLIEAPEKVWIDSVFAVCPFLAILGNAAGRSDFLDESLKQFLVHHKLLFDHVTGLYHQGINFNGPGVISEDHWSRGNGWAAIAMAEMVTEMPMNVELVKIFSDFMAACIKFQDENGLWHQEMTMHDSYVETSGTGLILYALGRGLELGLIPKSFRENFLKGLRGYLTYIGLDGSVFNTCEGCRCPGNGKIADYLAKPWHLNDVHAFGPAALVFTQAFQLGINEIEIHQ